MLDENLIFITLIIVFLIFIIRKQSVLIALLVVVYLAYNFYSARFINPREFINWLQNQVFGAFTTKPYSIDTYSNMPSNSVSTNANDYKLDKRTRIKDITIETMITAIPVLLDYKLFLEKVISFTLSINTDDPIQRNFLANKLQVKMSQIFHNAYNTVVEKIYPMQSYNELLLAEREFNDTLNIFIFLGLDDNTNHNLAELQNEFTDFNKKLNSYVADKVNNITHSEYNIYYNKIPETYEPQPANNVRI